MKLVKRIFIFIVGMMLSLPILAQIQFKPYLDVPVSIDGEQLAHAWMGGLNSPQFQKMDLNDDNQPDLVVFDRTSSKLLTFISDGNQYNYVPEYEYLFPIDINSWIVLADYDCDGKKDLFTNALLGIKVYRNISSTNLEWELIADPLLTMGTNSMINLQINETDIPSINDIDGDGDLDILLFNFFSGDRIDFHINRSMEDNGNCEELAFERIDRHWGKLEECDCGIFAFDQTCDELVTNRTQRTNHVGGKALLTLDNDGDGDMDLLFSDESCEDLVYFENIGDENMAQFDGFVDQFPNAVNPASFPSFPAGYYEDINFDGVKDLLVAPNTAQNSGAAIDFRASVFQYINNGTDNNPNFEFENDRFLQGESIDLGEEARPLFLDFDDDGDQDLLIGGLGAVHEEGFYATLTMFKNVGSSIQPSFELMNDDYLNLSSLQLNNLSVYLEDANQDNIKDLIISANSKSQTVTKQLLVFTNLSAIEGSYIFDETPSTPFSFSPLFNENLYFLDVNQDNFIDILVGKPTGRVEYHENDQSNSFQLIDNDFMGIGDDAFKRNPTMTTADLNGDELEELIVSDGTGAINIYLDFLNNQENPDNSINSILFNIVTDKNEITRFGKQTWISFADLNNDQLPDMVTGSIQGGLQLFSNESSSEFPNGNDNSLSLLVYPNPSTNSSVLKIKSNQNADFSIFTLLGQQIREEKSLQKQVVLPIDLTGFTNGIYIIKAVGAEGEVSEKIIVQK